MEKDFGYPPFMDYNLNPNFNLGGNFSNNTSSQDSNDIYKDPFFNPISQYEQAFIYYRYLCMQMDYKIRCKEYEKMCKDSLSTNKNSESARRNNINWYIKSHKITIVGFYFFYILLLRLENQIFVEQIKQNF